MNPALLILGAKLRMAWHEIASVRKQSKLKVAVITVFAGGIWLAAYGCFHEGFEWLIRFGGEEQSDPLKVGYIIMARMLAVLGLAVFFMLVFSNVLVAFSTLYRSREVPFLLQAPISFRAFFIARFWECVGFSSWALAYLGSPLILAYGRSSGASPVFYIAAVAFFLPFIIVPACVGCMITMILARAFPQQRVRVMIGLGVVAVGLLFLYIRDVLDATRLSQDVALAAVMDATSRTQTPFLPSYWATRGILAAAERNFRECAFQFLLLLSNALMCVWLTAEMAQRIFYRGFSFLAGQDRTRFKRLDQGVLGRADSLLCWLPNPARALVVKDIKLFWRDPTQWSQFVIFFGILAVYVANLHGVGNSRYTSDMWRSWIACLNIGSCTLVLATLTSRFVFPLVSLEGRRFWILGLAPFTFRRLVWQKFWLSVCTTSLFTVGLAALSGRMLHIPALHFWLSIYSVVVANFGLAGLAVGLGTLYPNFQEDNPARIVSGMGGTLNFLLSVGYVVLIVGAQTVILQWHVLERFTTPQAFWRTLGIAVLSITLVSLVTSLLPLYLGLRNLSDMEF
jgi:ABC-2 type transport system permease protein